MTLVTIKRNTHSRGFRHDHYDARHDDCTLHSALNSKKLRMRNAYQPVGEGPEFQKLGRRRLIEWLASRNIENSEGAEFQRAIQPCQHFSNKKRRKNNPPCRFFHSRGVPAPAVSVESGSG